VRTPDDLIVRAAMAVHWNQGSLGDPAYPDYVVNSKEACSDERALAAAVRGVLDLAGLKFGAEGRLLGVTSALPNAGWDGLNSLD
jgi:hypothetical protein